MPRNPKKDSRTSEKSSWPLDFKALWTVFIGFFSKPFPEESTDDTITKLPIEHPRVASALLQALGVASRASLPFTVTLEWAEQRFTDPGDDPRKYQDDLALFLVLATTVFSDRIQLDVPG